jgi:hypothetical protein
MSSSYLVFSSLSLLALSTESVISNGVWGFFPLICFEISKRTLKRVFVVFCVQDFFPATSSVAGVLLCFCLDGWDLVFVHRQYFQGVASETLNET